MTPLLLAATLVVSAPKLKDRPGADPYLGRWAATNLLVNGQADPQWAGLEYEFGPAGKWTIYRNGEELSGGPRTYLADPKPRPAAMDLTEGVAGKPMPGIYKVEGDTLTVAFHIGGGVRPGTFDGAPGVMTIVFSRVKVPK
jgi:uncharacterized protein (TIGR03067 family)